MSEVKRPHIQVPKSHLKRFAHKTRDGHKVFVLDLKSKRIYEKKINALGTAEKGYYSEEIETAFSKIEAQFGNQAKAARDFSNKKIQTLVMGPDETYIIKEYFWLMLKRSELLVNDFNKRLPPDVEVSKNEFNQMLKDASDSNMFQNYRVLFFHNKTLGDFILPRNTFFSIENSKWLMPVDPKCAFLLVPPKEYKKYVCNDGIVEYPFVDDIDLEKINALAILNEVHFNKSFVVAQQKRTLEYLKDTYLKDAFF